MKNHVTKLFAVFLSLCFLLTVAFADTNKDGQDASELIHVDVVENRRSQYLDDCSYLLYVSYPDIELCADDVSRFPELASVLKADMEEYRLSVEQTYDDLYAARGEFRKNVFGNDGFNCLYESMRTDVVRADGNVLSLMFVREGYYGGAHGDYGVLTLNYDPVSGKHLEIPDLVSDADALYAAVKEDLRERYPEDDWDLGSLDEMFSAEACTVFSVGYSGITFYFNPYVLGSYASGMHYAFVAYADYKDLFNEKVTQVPESYVIPMGEVGMYGPDNLVPQATMFDGFRFDLDENGMPETIKAAYQADNADYYSSITVSVNGKQATLNDCFCYYFSLYLVHTPKQDSIWAFTTADDDYGILYVAGLDGNGAVWQKESYNLSPTGSFLEEEEGSLTKVRINAPVDPEKLYMGSIADVLGTYFTKDVYCVGPDGCPKRSADLYLIDSDYEIISTAPLKGNRVSEDGRPGEETVLPAGTAMYVYRSDGLLYETTFVDVRLKDGHLCRLTYSTNEESWDRVVAGVTEYEAFEELPYAG